VTAYSKPYVVPCSVGVCRKPATVQVFNAGGFFVGLACDKCGREWVATMNAKAAPVDPGKSAPRRR